MGVAVEPSNRLVLAADARYITYEQTAGFKDAGFNPDGSLKGFGWRNIWSSSFGAEWKVAPALALRGGYNVAGHPVRDSLAAFNVAAPAVVKHHLTLGAGVRVSPTVEISGAYYHGFEHGVGGQMLTPSGPIPGTRVYSDLSEDSFLLQFSLIPK
jgi:long-chain fatty acid transport protein